MEELEKLVEEIVSYLSEDERWENRKPLSVQLIHAKFKVEEEVARRALIQLTEQLALKIDADGTFRYAPSHRPGPVMPPMSNLRMSA